MRNLKVCICVSLIIIFLTSCYSQNWLYNHPAQHPGSYWESEDGNISFEISAEDYFHNGIINHNGNDMNMVFIIALNSNMICAITPELFDSEKITEGEIECTEQWSICTVEKDMVIVEILVTELLTEGERITFYRKNRIKTRDTHI